MMLPTGDRKFARDLLASIWTSNCARFLPLYPSTRCFAWLKWLLNEWSKIRPCCYINVVLHTFYQSSMALVHFHLQILPCSWRLTLWSWICSMNDSWLNPKLERREQWLDSRSDANTKSFLCCWVCFTHDEWMKLQEKRKGKRVHNRALHRKSSDTMLKVCANMRGNKRAMKMLNDQNQ